MGKKLNINVESKNIKADNDIVKSTLNESTFDYKNVGITEEKDISELIKLEKEIKFHQEKTFEHIIRYSEAIYIANQIFSHRGSGSFGVWTENLGISRETANIAIRRYVMYLEQKNEKIMLLPTRIIKAITGKNKENFEEAEIIEVIEAEKPSKVLLQIQNKKKEKQFEDETLLIQHLNKERIRKTELMHKLKIELMEIEKQLYELKEKNK